MQYPRLGTVLRGARGEYARAERPRLGGVRRRLRVRRALRPDLRGQDDAPREPPVRRGARRVGARGAAASVAPAPERRLHLRRVRAGDTSSTSRSRSATTRSRRCSASRCRRGSSSSSRASSSPPCSFSTTTTSSTTTCTPATSSSRTATTGPIVKISDFGISTELRGMPAIRPNVVHHAIMAPEIIATGYTGKQSDIYQIGLLLYWMLAGESAVPRDVAVRGARALRGRRGAPPPGRGARDAARAPRREDAPPPGAVPVRLGARSVGGAARRFRPGRGDSCSRRAERATLARRMAGERVRTGAGVAAGAGSVLRAVRALPVIVVEPGGPARQRERRGARAVRLLARRARRDAHPRLHGGAAPGARSGPGSASSAATRRRSTAAPTAARTGASSGSCRSRGRRSSRARRTSCRRCRT